MNGKDAAWSAKVVTGTYQHPHPKLCELMRDVALGRKEVDEAQREWVAFCEANGIEPVNRRGQ